MSDNLIQRLRDLRNGLFPDIETVNAVLDKAIAQAEAQEAQAVELSDEELQHRALRWSCDHDQSIFTYSQSLAEFGKHLRDHGYLKPSQATGEQTPVASAPVCMGCFSQEAVCRQPGLCVSGRPKWIPSGVSPEARDMAIEALERFLGLLKIIQGDSSISQMDVMHVLARGSALEALSALRG